MAFNDTSNTSDDLSTDGVRSRALPAILVMCGATLFGTSCTPYLLWPVAATGAAVCTAIAHRWPEAKPVSEPITVNFPSGLKGQISHVGFEASSRNNECAASIRIVDDGRRSGQIKPGKYGEAYWKNMDMDNKNLLNIANSELGKYCYPSRIKISSSIGPKNTEFKETYYFRKGDGSFDMKHYDGCEAVY